MYVAAVQMTILHHLMLLQVNNYEWLWNEEQHWTDVMYVM